MRGRAVALLLPLLLPALCSGCFFYDSTWHQEAQSQERQAAALTPDAPHAEATDGRWHTTREIPVHAFATERYRAEVHAWQAHVGELLEHANEVLAPTLGVRLVLADAGPWDAPPATSLESLLDTLEQEHPVDEGLVIGLMGSMAQLSSTFDTIGMARVHGRHLVVRAMNDAAESDAIDEAFDRLSDDERARVRRRRKAHKELSVLLHEIGHAYGAIHVRGRTALMSPVYDEDMERYAAHTLALIRPAADQRARPEGERDQRALVEKLVEVLRAHPDGWVDEERDATLARYEQFLAGGATTGGSTAAAREWDDRAGTLWDVTGLPDADRTAFHRAQDASGGGHPRQAWELLAPLVDRHPDVYAVQEMACELCQQGLAPPDAASSCERMMELATRYGRE